MFVDVHEGGILDALFGIPPPNSPWEGIWFDLPANRHSQGCNFSFADGHAEHWRWTAPKLFKEIGQEIAGDGDMKDFRRVQRSVRPETRYPNIYQPE